MSDEVEFDPESTAPIWAFGDLMSVLLGAFVLILVGVIGMQLQLSHKLDEAVKQRQAEERRRTTLEQALATPLAQGRVTLVNGRIGIRGSLLFALNSDQLQPEGRNVIQSLAAPLSQYLHARDELLMVSGFTDDQPVHGDNRHFSDNWELSAQRALTVTRALIAAGVPADSVFAAAFGAQQPVDSNADEEGRAKNRRVEIAPIPTASAGANAAQSRRTRPCAASVKPGHPRAADRRDGSSAPPASMARRAACWTSGWTTAWRRSSTDEWTMQPATERRTTRRRAAAHWANWSTASTSDASAERATYPELPALDAFRTLWSSIRSDSQLQQSVAHTPTDAGPAQFRRAGQPRHRADARAVARNICGSSSHTSMTWHGWSSWRVPALRRWRVRERSRRLGGAGDERERPWASHLRPACSATLANYADRPSLGEHHRRAAPSPSSALSPTSSIRASLLRSNGHHGRHLGRIVGRAPYGHLA